MAELELDLADRLAVRRLKYVRPRSMRSPRWRDSAYLAKFVERRYLYWAIDSPLEPQRQAAIKAIAVHRMARRRKMSNEAQWLEVVQAVDRLIEEAERLAGHRIKPAAI